MATIRGAISVGAPDPELKTSPILEELDEDYAEIAKQAEELPVCYFNGVKYAAGKYVCSGSGELLRCEKGIWLREGGCDPDNP